MVGGNQLRPDQMPVIRPKIAAGNGSIGGSLNTDAKLCADAMSDAYRLAQVSNRRAAPSANLFAFGIRDAAFRYCKSLSMGTCYQLVKSVSTPAGKLPWKKPIRPQGGFLPQNLPIGIDTWLTHG